jgi:uncharacterized membrane protein YdjX (TVP38/TMEM64 family)
VNSDDTNPVFEGIKPSWEDVFKNLIFIFVAIGVAYWVTVSVGIDNVRSTVQSAGLLGPFIIILLKITTLVVVPLGGTPLYPIAGALFGFWNAFFITLAGDIIGSAICFYISRKFGKTVLHFFMSKQYLPMVEKVVEQASNKKTFVKTRVFFTGFPELFAYAAGITKIPFPFFVFVHNGIHAIPAVLLILFGNLLVAGNVTALILTGVVTSLLAVAGVLWFHLNLKRSA